MATTDEKGLAGCRDGRAGTFCFSDGGDILLFEEKLNVPELPMKSRMSPKREGDRDIHLFFEKKNVPGTGWDILLFKEKLNVPESVQRKAECPRKRGQ